MLFTIDFRREIDDLLREVREERPPERPPDKSTDRYAPRPPVETYRDSYKERAR